MKCPRCSAELSPQDLFAGGRHATVAGCGSCGGQWMKANDLQRFSEVVEPVLFEIRQLPTVAKQLKEMHCPECEGHPPLSKLRAERDRHVMLDLCARCRGIWLDKNELQAIQRDSLVQVLADLGKYVAR